MIPETKTIAGMEFTDISSENFREYVYESGFVLRIESPKWLHVRPTGAHRLIDGEGVSHRIDMEGCKDIRWKSAGGREFVV